MQIPKDQILALLAERGDQGQADQANQELPDQVDTDQHGGMLEKFGLSPADLIARFTGGGGGGGGPLGGLGGKLGL